MRFTRQLVVAGLTVVTVVSATSAILPEAGPGSPPESPSVRQLAGSQDNVRDSLRVEAGGVADAINADHLRSAELRAVDGPAEDAADVAADDAVESLLRTP